MSIQYRQPNVQESLKSCEVALLWLQTSRASGAYAEYRETAEYQPWVREAEEAALLYHLAAEVNGAVITATHNWCRLASWAGLLGISVIDTGPGSRAGQLQTMRDFAERWRQKLCTFLADVFAIEQAVDLISEVYFDGHEVLFADTKEQLTSSYESLELLVAGYNCFAQENGKPSSWTVIMNCFFGV